jgi:hypothetical protein
MGPSRELWDGDPIFKRNLPANTWMLYNRNYTLATSSGTVVLLLIQRLNGYRDIDEFTEFGLISKFAEIQLAKLASAGFTN